jgi:hypothetical protein
MEAIMAYVAHPREFQSAVPFKYPAQQVASRPGPTKSSTPRRGFWRRLYDAIMEAHQRDVEREIGRYFARHGKMTDSMEREISERFFGNSSRGF